MVALVEKEEDEEEDAEGEVESDHHFTSLVAQRSLTIGAVSSEEDWLRSNVFAQGARLKAKFT